MCVLVYCEIKSFVLFEIPVFGIPVPKGTICTFIKKLHMKLRLVSLKESLGSYIRVCLITQLPKTSTLQCMCHYVM
jgi:hypothetical protein